MISWTKVAFIHKFFLSLLVSFLFTSFWDRKDYRLFFPQRLQLCMACERYDASLRHPHLWNKVLYAFFFLLLMLSWKLPFCLHHFKFLFSFCIDTFVYASSGLPGAGTCWVEMTNERWHNQCTVIYVRHT